jgi:hypothetical protein
MPSVPESRDSDSRVPDSRAPESGAAALAWIQALREEDSRTIWRGLDHDFRLALVQRWMFDHPAALRVPTAIGTSRTALAAVLADQDSEHALWPQCAEVGAGIIRSEIGAVESADPHPDIGVRAVGRSLQVVSLGPLLLAMRQTDSGWKVASVGSRVLRPGWPPEWADRPVEPTRQRGRRRG